MEGYCFEPYFPQILDFLKVFRFSFPVPVVGKIYRSRFALVKKFKLDLLASLPKSLWKLQGGFIRSKRLQPSRPRLLEFSRIFNTAYFFYPNNPRMNRIHRYRVDGRLVLSVVTQRGEERCVTTLKRLWSSLTEGRFVLKKI